MVAAFVPTIDSIANLLAESRATAEIVACLHATFEEGIA
jgi:hypothetical protein